MRLLPARRQAAAFAAVLALLLAQALGLAHRIAHAQPAQAGVLHTHSHAHEHEPGHPILAAAFDQHDEGSAECRLIDQAGHGDAAAAPTVAPGDLVAPDGGAARPSPTATFLTACTQPYSARGPPSFLA